MRGSTSIFGWKYAVFAGIFLALLSLYPQFYLEYRRGENYNGATFFYENDETAYAAYLQALIDGRPRNNDVYSGGGAPQEYETLYTIQFVPAYTISIPARLFGITSEKVFLFVSAVCAFLTSLAIFGFVYKVTKNPKFSAASVLFILLLGPVIAGISILKGTLGLGPSAFYLTFVRRYTPAVAFPVIFIIISSVWLGLKSSKTGKTYFYAFITGTCLSLLAYSYFFLWTAMLGWVFCIAALCLFFQTENRKKQFVNFWLPTVSFLLVTIAPYFFLLSKRHETTDASQILEKTRTLVLLRPTLAFGCAVLAATVFFIKFGYFNLKKQSVLFVISFSILPFFVFNQQIVTGYSLQPHHYDKYILNYLVLLAFVLLVYSICGQNLQKVNSVGWLFIALLLSGWGIIEMHYTARSRYLFNSERDEMVLVNRRLAELAKENFEASTSQITLNFNVLQGNTQPTIAPQGVLWAEHMFFLANMSVEEHRRRYFSFLYYQNRDENWLRENLQNCPNQSCRALLGWNFKKAFSINAQEQADEEILKIVEEYGNFSGKFSSSDAFNPGLSYVIAPNNNSADFTKLDLWYERDEGESYGKYLLYRVKKITDR